MTEQRLMSTAEVAAALRLSPRHVARLAANGALPAHRLPSPQNRGAFLFDAADVAALAARKGIR